MARVRADGHIRNIHRDQAGIGKLESDNLGKLLADGYGHSSGTMVIHKKGAGFWVLAYSSQTVEAFAST